MPEKVSTVQQVWKSDIKTLIDTDETVFSGSYGQQQEVDLTPPNYQSGQIMKVVAYATGPSVKGYAGYIYLFDTDPVIGDGVDNLTAEQNEAVIAVIEVASGDWVLDTSTGVAANLLCCGPIEFDPRAALWVAWKHNDADETNIHPGANNTIGVAGWAHLAQDLRR